MERNVDKIKRLEHELGRYQKKVADQNRELGALRAELEAAHAGNRETQALVDAVLTAVALAHGIPVYEETGTKPSASGFGPERTSSAMSELSRLRGSEGYEDCEDEAEDPDEPGKVLGWRLSVPRFTVGGMRENYEIHARLDAQSDSYVLGVSARRDDGPSPT